MRLARIQGAPSSAGSLSSLLNTLEVCVGVILPDGNVSDPTLLESQSSDSATSHWTLHEPPAFCMGELSSLVKKQGGKFLPVLSEGMGRRAERGYLIDDQVVDSLKIVRSDGITLNLEDPHMINKAGPDLILTPLTSTFLTADMKLNMTAFARPSGIHFACENPSIWADYNEHFKQFDQISVREGKWEEKKMVYHLVNTPLGSEEKQPDTEIELRLSVVSVAEGLENRAVTLSAPIAACLRWLRSQNLNKGFVEIEYIKNFVGGVRWWCTVSPRDRSQGSSPKSGVGDPLVIKGDSKIAETTAADMRLAQTPIAETSTSHRHAKGRATTEPRSGDKEARMTAASEVMETVFSVVVPSDRERNMIDMFSPKIAEEWYTGVQYTVSPQKPAASRILQVNKALRAAQAKTSGESVVSTSGK